jgi:hypothetical protein
MTDSATSATFGALQTFGEGVGAIVMGELVGAIAEEVTKRVRVHRQEIGGPTTGSGSGKYDTLLDLLLDVSVETVFLLLGISFVEKAMPSVTEELSSMILFIIGISCQANYLPSNLKKLTNSLLKDKDNLVVVNPED